MALHETETDDLESQQSRTIPLLDETSTTTNYDDVAARKVRSLWRRIVQVRKFIILAKEAQNGGQLAASYVTLPIDETEAVLRGSTSSGTDAPPALPNDHDHDHDHHPQTIVDIHEEPETNSTIIGTATDAKNQQNASIAEIMKTKNLVSLNQFGGVKGIAEALNTDLEAGISGDQEDLNLRTAQTNSDNPITGQATEAIPSPSFFRILRNHCNDVAIIIMILFIAAGLSIGFGMKIDGAKTGWYEGFFIIVAIIILVVAPALRDHLQLKRSRRDRPILLEEKSVSVYRGNTEQKVYASELVQGDVLLLETGCLVPADGLFIRGEFLVVHDGLESTVDEEDPFLFHGFMVTHGSGRMLVTTVGEGTEFSKLMSSAAASAQTPDRTTRFPAQLDRLSRFTQIIGLLLSVIILVVLFVRFMLDNHFYSDPDLPQFKGKPDTSYEFMNIIERIVMKPRGNIGANIVALLTAAMVGVVEGIPFIITSVSILWRKKMLPKEAYSDQGLLGSVIVGSSTVICTDKTPLNPADVSMCFIGTEEVFQTTRSNLSGIQKSIREALGIGICAPLVLPSSPRKEDPLIPWASSNLEIELDTLWQSNRVMKIKRLSPNEEGSGVLMKENTATGNMSLHFKGPALTILGKCSNYYDMNGNTRRLDDSEREVFEKNIEEMQSRDLKTIAYAYKRIDDPVVEEDNLTLIAMVGIKNYTCCAKIEKTLKDFKDAQVKFVLVSEDDMTELKNIAIACKILPPGGLVITGEDFRNYSEQEKMDKANMICVMGNSLPEDRILLMEYLKRKGGVVLALGSRTDDIPMQTRANIGVTMGRRSCQMVRESSNLEVFDWSLSSLLTLIQCGRCTYYNIQKYIQLDLVTNIAGTLIASITTVWLGSNSITGIQLFWTNLVTTFVIGPVLLMEPPNNELMRKPPIRPNESLISVHMCRNMIIQALYQTTILVTFQIKGHHLLRFFRICHKQQHVSKSMIFNSFVLCQMFNQVNSREVENINVLMRIHRNRWFPLAVVLVLGLQASFIQVAHAVNRDENLSLAQWGVCFIIGIVSCLVDAAAKGTWKLTKKLLSRFHTIPPPTMTHSDSAF
ncbi:calcium-transporting ATPase 12, plasma membrane-type-like [Humulus lupulus]|uniref:calcium-transporting ATPase 12, plasma membrane-type-like n=1 Tax=Humulus lupulus TaxID=3486 RepID=UPI002B404FD6|nr:calcium-transporting ATPase 12, plasma membrane-type-like [Humulus lupulus]